MKPNKTPLTSLPSDTALLLSWVAGHIACLLSSRCVPCVIALKMRWINASQDQLATFMARVVAIEPEGEHRLLDKSLSDHILEGWRCPSNGNVWETQALQAAKWN